MLFFLTQWLATRYDRVSLEQVLYQMQTSISGTSKKLTSSASIRVGVFGTLLTLIEIMAYLVFSGKAQKLLGRWKVYAGYCHGKLCRFFAKRMLPLAMVLLLTSLMLFGFRMEIFAYVENSVTESDFIEEHYADPDTVQLTFPEEKRNLVYIFLESMENTFADPTSCSTVEANYIPELTQLAQENVSFSHSTGLGGAQSLEGTTWTAAAMVAQTSGVTIKVPLTGDDYGEEEYYMPGITALGDILEAEGYRQVLLLGSKGAFANRDAYFADHGNYEMVDLIALKQEGRLDPDYYEWWGYEDEKLFAYAKEELTRLGEAGEPFNFTMLTADTHFPDGYVCRLCENTYDEQYGNVMKCSDQQLGAFIKWLQEQPFYENTTVILSGDHLTMDPEFLADIDDAYIRTNYNCILNAPITPVQTQNRQFGTIDMFPTTLAAMGVQIEGDRLGLGTNLFSARKTLSEEFGHIQLDAELQKDSPFYFEKFFELPTEPTESN
ncbi:MAG: LTA synthase family protein [Oscillospiraceae bacterium]|nr:LTA synthase family protein [Oscillospiraceae bacterium]